MKIAKATPTTINALRQYLLELEEAIDSCGDNAQIADIARKFPVKWRVIVEGYETLIENACDSSLNYLEFRPDIKMFLEQQAVDPKLSERSHYKFIQEYGFYVQKLLNDFVEGSEMIHTVKIDIGSDVSIVTAGFLQGSSRFRELAKFAEEMIQQGYCFYQESAIQQVLIKSHSEPLVFQPTGVSVQADHVLICYPSSPAYWTNVQAWKNATDIMAKILMMTIKQQTP